MTTSSSKDNAGVNPDTEPTSAGFSIGAIMRNPAAGAFMGFALNRPLFAGG